MRSRVRRAWAPVAILAAVALVGLSPGSASADQHDPLNDLLDQVRNQLVPPPSSTHPVGDVASTPSAAAPSPSSDDDSPGHETKNPSGPDHGAAEVADVDLGDQDVADAGDNTATVQDDDSTNADSTLLALGGQEILGAHADSNGQNESHFGDPLAPLCDSSGGAVCLRLLYADAFATDDGQTSHSRSDNGVASACLGGNSADPQAKCEGPVAADLVTSNGEAQRNQATGRTTASSESHVADVCLQQPGATAGGCALGATAAHSKGQADSGGAKSSASRESWLLDVTANGESQGRVDDPTAIAIQPDCVDPSAVCAFLNQGETYLGDGIAGHAQDALDLGVLPGTPVTVQGDVSHTETLVHNDGGNVSTGSEGDLPGGGPGAPGAEAGGGPADIGPGGLLPNTGGVWSGLLALGLLGVGAGACSIAYSRRRAAALG